MSQPEQVVLVRRYNAPVLHRPSCRHLVGKPVGSMAYFLKPLTDQDREHVANGCLRACGTCKPV